MSEIIIFSKIESIEKCLSRIEEKRTSLKFNLEDYDTLDIIVLNLQRACQQSIDLAMFIVAEQKLGLPKESAGAFTLLAENNLITDEVAKAMRSMVGFRNIAIHEYQKIDPKIVKSILNDHLNDFKNFTSQLIKK